MVDTYKAPFGTYAVMAGIVNATGKAEIAAMFVNLKSLFIPASGTSCSHPDFNEIKPAVANKIGAELDAMAAVIAASASA